jgi:hypothetical protein
MNFYPNGISLDEARLIADRPRRGPKRPLLRRPGKSGAGRTK